MGSFEQVRESLPNKQQRQKIDVVRETAKGYVDIASKEVTHHMPQKDNIYRRAIKSTKDDIQRRTEKLAHEWRENIDRIQDDRKDPEKTVEQLLSESHQATEKAIEARKGGTFEGMSRTTFMSKQALLRAMREKLEIGDKYPIKDTSQDFVKTRELLKNAQENIWAGRLDPRWVKRLMETDDIIHSETLDRGHRGPPKKITLRCGITCIAKPEYLHIYIPHRAVTAYELSERLGLKMVPMTVFREFDGSTASVQLWVDGLEKGDAHLPNDANVFDYLTAQTDRITKYDTLKDDEFRGDHHVNVNWGRTRAGQCVLYDNDECFSSLTPIPDIPSEKVPQFIPSPELRKGMIQLDLSGLSLFEANKQTTLQRRDKLIQTIEAHESREASKNEQEAQPPGS